MLTLCIRYTIDQNKLDRFETYARTWPEVIVRHGGTLIGYFLPTKLAGSTNTALALIDFADLGAYQRYRDGLAGDPAAKENVRQIEEAGCILNEDRSFLRRAG